MATEVIMPKVDMVMDSGTLVEWFKKEGDTVQKGDPLFVVLTDKANIEVEAPGSGILAGVTAKPDDVIPVSQVIAYILAPGEALPQKAAAVPEKAAAAVPTVAEKAAPQAVAAAVAPPASEELLRATPLARLLAQELGVDLRTVKGCGPRGRIYKSDVIAAAEAAKSAPAAAVATAAPAPTRATFTVSMPQGDTGMTITLPPSPIRERVPLKGVRAIIAKRLAYSAATAPHIFLSINVDMSEAVRLRQMLNPKFEKTVQSKLSYTAIIAYVVSKLLPKHPFLNSSLVENDILLWDEVHLGIATAIGDDLIVPVVRRANSLSMEDTVKEMNRLLNAARSNKLEPSEMTGSTFSISNLGMFGIDDFTMILNPPEAAILGVGKMTDTPVVTATGTTEVRPIIRFTLATDHRVNDGVRAAKFLNDLKQSLENPYLLF